MPGTISGSVTLKNVRVGLAPEVHRRVLQRPVESAHPRAHRHRDEADLERDVRDEDRGVARRPAEVEEQGQQRGAHHHLGSGQRQYQEGVDRRLAAEALAHKRDGAPSVPEHQRDHGGHRGDVQAQLQARRSAPGT